MYKLYMISDVFWIAGQEFAIIFENELIETIRLDKL